MEILKIALPGMLILGMLGSGIPAKSEYKEVNGAIMPHHLLVADFMEDLYSSLDQTSYERIILISPNHFGYGYDSIQTAAEVTREPGNTLFCDTLSVELLEKSGTAVNTGSLINNEHGITAHVPFIKRHFHNTPIIPVTIKPGADYRQLDQLVETLASLQGAKTLVIASVDFSHVIDEQTALAKDNATINWLSSNHVNTTGPRLLSQIKELAGINNGNPDSTAIDSPETIYVLYRLMTINGSTDFTLHNRTSSSSLLKNPDPAENTSHIFGTFS